jgi:predicted  nucleic acid-binding Zn-ribbon protein
VSHIPVLPVRDDDATVVRGLLENEMQVLRDLPARVTSLEGQFLQFRAEVRVEFSALRQEIRQVDRKIDTRIDELGAEMRTLFENAIDRIKNIQHG